MRESIQSCVSRYLDLPKKPAAVVGKHIATPYLLDEDDELTTDDDKPG